jgi:hypothetical protein
VENNKKNIKQRREKKLQAKMTTLMRWHSMAQVFLNSTTIMKSNKQPTYIEKYSLTHPLTLMMII